jgi:hypothetical protein
LEQEKVMKFNDYLLTLDGYCCIIWVDQLSQTENADQGRFALVGFVGVEEDFVMVWPDEGAGAPTAIRFKDIKAIEIADEGGEKAEDDREEDMHAKFEKYYRRYKDQS